jgi:hypothetical protein
MAFGFKVIIGVDNVKVRLHGGGIQALNYLNLLVI